MTPYDNGFWAEVGPGVKEPRIMRDPGSLGKIAKAF